ncbi:MAG: toll/interleukin-1 receptor domain-containing protein [Candidatus Babeliaceae bacterium]|nr:toll/interleukin-1 receptor domain-containing protein [Candidatus Babeliaceae bacterium]
MMRWVEKGKHEIDCDRSVESVRIDSLLSGVQPTKSTGGRWDVFISYATKDFAIIQEIIIDLKQKKITYWWDREQLLPDDDVIGQLDHGLKNSQKLLLCISYNQIDLGWSRAEYGAILNKFITRQTQQKVVPLIIDDLQDSDFPPLISNIYHTRWSDKESYQQLLKALKQNTKPPKRIVTELPRELRYKITEFLTSLPNIYDNNAQQVLIDRAGLDPQLQQQIKFNASPEQFVQLLISTINKYGILEDGRNALEAILESTKDSIGKDRREYCDLLIQELHKFRLNLN